MTDYSKLLRHFGRIYVFDIDGTLSNAEHRVHHLLGAKKNWAGFFADMGDDEPIQAIIRLSNLVAMYGDFVMLLTGRGVEHVEATQEWLIQHEVFYHALVMRPEGDRRSDDIVKIEALHKAIAPEHRHKIQTIFEDRKRVVDALRAEGYHVCQVAPGEF